MDLRDWKDSTDWKVEMPFFDLFWFLVVPASNNAPVFWKTS